MQTQEQTLLTALGEESIEQPNSLIDGGLDALQAWNDGEIIRPFITKLPERYERGEFQPHIHFTVGDGSFGNVPCCGVFMASEQHYEVGLSFLLGTSVGETQLPMLVKAVHVMKNEQGEVRTLPLRDSIVWLQRLDDCVGCATDSLYFSVELGNFVGSRRPRAEDWKLDKIGILGAMTSLPQQLPDQIVKCGPIVMEDLTNEHSESGRDGLMTPELSKFFDGLELAVYDFGVSCFLQKPLDFGVNIQDILIGPFESFSYPF